MAVKRYRPSVGSTSGTIYRIEKATTTAGYDPEVAVYGYDACAFYGTNSVTLSYPAITDIPTNTISRISIVYRACCTTGGSRGGVIQLLNNDTGITADSIDLIQYGSSTDPYLHDPANCVTHNVPSGAWDLILNGSWSIRVQGRSTNTTLFTIICVDIEYEEPTDFRIGANKLKKALLENNIIDRIYKGSFLLFQYDGLPNTLRELKYIQSQWYPLTYIDTGVAWNNSTKIEAEIVTYSVGTNGNKLFVATQGDAGMPGFTYLYIDTSNQVVGSNVTVSNYTVGTNTVTATYSSSTSSNIYITAWSDIYWACTFRYKNIKIYNGDTLLRDYVPCYRKSDEIAGLYDKVNKVLYTSDGSSEYLKGPDAEITLPEAYQEVEYIQSTGTQYFDTDLLGKPGLKTYAKLQVNNNISDSGVLVGARNDTGQTRCYLGYRQYNSSVNFGYQEEQQSGVTPTNNDINAFEYEIKSGQLVIKKNGTVILDQQHTTTFSTSYTMYVFAINYTGTASQYLSCNLYELKIWDNNVLVRDYIPCYRKSDGVIGMYDIVTNTFKVNAGTGTFTKGPDI